MSENNKQNTNNEAIKKTLSRLANFSYQFSPESQTDIGPDLHKHLVLQAFSSLPEEWNTVEKIQLQLETLFDLKFESAEILDAIISLVKAGKVERHRSDDSSYKIHFIEKIKINDAADSKKDLKLRALQEWFNQTEKELDVKLTQEQTGYLMEDIEIFVGLLAAEGGAQAIKTAFGNSPTSPDPLSEIKHKPRWKKRSDEYDKLRNDAIQIFLKKSTEIRQKYVFELIESAFFLSLLHIDTSLSDLAKTALQNKILFLDSNIIYRLLGLQTESLQGMTERVIETSAKQFGCTLFVSQLSINELTTSLQRAVKYLKANPPLERDFEKIKLSFTGESRGFIIAYWKEYAKNGTSLEHFANKYSNIDKILADKYNIQVTTNYIDAVIKDGYISAEINQYKKFLVGKEQNRHISDAVVVPNESPKHENLIIHDVRLLRIVEKIRGKQCEKFSQANAWLLTADGDLITYSQLRKGIGEKNIPVAIHAKEWLLFLRQWLPRNEDYEKVFINLVFSERIQSFSSFSPIIIDQVVRILSSYDNVTPQIAAEILADYDFTKKLMTIQKKAEFEFIEDYGEENLKDMQKEELLQGIIVEKTKNLIDNRLLSLIEKKEHERANTSYEKAQIERKLLDEKQEKEKLATDLNKQKNQIDGLTNKIGEIAANLENEKESKETLEKSLQATKWVVGALIATILIFFVEPKIGNIVNSFISKELANYIRFLIYLIAITLLLGIGLGMKKAWKYISIIDTAAGTIAVFWFLYSLIFK
jgi:hypothetical protein